MFTGIIESLGTIVSVTHSSADRSESAVLTVDAGSLNVADFAIGDSIAVNGVCLTVIRIQPLENNVYFDVSPETLTKCLINQWQSGDRVNIESALTLQKPLGGHLVSGHVDGKGVLIKRLDSEQSTWMQFRSPRSIGRYIAVKGSITVDGISLTSNEVEDQQEETLFDVTIVPHTLNCTNLGSITEGDSVHLEIDLLARYIERIRDSDRTISP
jgi:riboflavin synthase